MKLFQGSLTRTADHLQTLDLNIAGFLLSALLGFVFVLLVGFWLEGASNRQIVANMIAELYSGAAEVVTHSIISGKTEFISFVSLLQTAGHGLAAGFLFVLLCVCRKGKCTGRQSEAGSQDENEISFHE